VGDGSEEIEADRRRPSVRALHQPVEPARIQATIGGRLLLEQAEVLDLTDRTMLLEVRDAALALALSLAPEVVVSVDLGGATTTLVTEPGRRASDNPTSRQVELILRERR
jgi:hypothetical protein